MATRSGNPAKKKKATAADFKKHGVEEITLPSGFTVDVRNPGGLQAFLGGGSSGEIPNSLMPIIQKALKSGKAVDVGADLLQDGQIDPKLLADMVQMMNAVAIKCLVNPKLYPEPTAEDVDRYNERHAGDEGFIPFEEPEELRSDDRLYVDELPDDDKQFIFAWLSSGVKDLETFREQQQAGVDAVVGVTSPEGTAQ